MRLGGAREEEDAARAAVQPVDHPEAPVDDLELLAQAPLVRSAPGDDEPSRRLVDREHVRVLVEDRRPALPAAHAIFLAGITVTSPNRSSWRTIDFAGPTATTTRSASGK